MSAPHLTPVETKMPDLEGLLLVQKKAALADPMPDRATRIRRLDKLHNAVVDNRARIIAACNKDFSSRAAAETQLAEIGPILEGIAYYRKRLKKFMKPQRRHCADDHHASPRRSALSTRWCGWDCGPWNFPFFFGAVTVGWGDCSWQPCDDQDIGICASVG